MARETSGTLPASLREEMPEQPAAFRVSYICAGSMLPDSPVLPAIAKGVKVEETAEFPCKILGRYMDPQCLIKAAPIASVIYKLLPGEAPHSSEVCDLKLHRERCELQARHLSLGCARVYVWLWPCKASGPANRLQTLVSDSSSQPPPDSLLPSEIASVLYLGHSHSRGNWQGARSSSDLFGVTPLIGHRFGG